MSSRKDRVKKNIASKVASSKTGQTVILQSLGEEGTNLVNALAKVLTKYKSESHAKEVKSHIFKFALKAKIMADDGKFTLENTADVGPLLMKYSDMMLIALKGGAQQTEEKKPDAAPSSSPSSRVPVPTVPELAAQHAKIAVELGKLMNANMQEKNQKLMQETLSAVGSEEFLTKVVSDPDYGDLRKDFSQNLEKLLESVSDPLHAHQTITSQSHFSDQYSSVIRIVRDFWSRVDRKEDEVGMSIFNKLVSAHKEYYDLLANCKYGDDPMKQHREFLHAFSHMLRMLDSWPLLTEKLKEVGADHESWAPGVSRDGYDHMAVAVHSALAEIFGKEYSSMTRKRFNTVFNLIIPILKESYREK